jgi:hypothetical protein
MAVTRGWELAFNGESHREDEKVLELDGGEGCPSNTDVLNDTKLYAFK